MAAARLLTGDAALGGSVVFHCQQAAEKALKAYLTYHSVAFRKTHGLGELVGQCVSVDASFVGLEKAADELTPYAWEYRYPGGDPAPAEVDIQDALRLAGDGVAFVRGKLPADVPP